MSRTRTRTSLHFTMLRDELAAIIPARTDPSKPAATVMAEAIMLYGINNFVCDMISLENRIAKVPTTAISKKKED